MQPPIELETKPAKYTFAEAEVRAAIRTGVSTFANGRGAGHILLMSPNGIEDQWRLAYTATTARYSYLIFSQGVTVDVPADLTSTRYVGMLRTPNGRWRLTSHQATVQIGTSHNVAFSTPGVAYLETISWYSTLCGVLFTGN